MVGSWLGNMVANQCSWGEVFSGAQSGREEVGQLAISARRLIEKPSTPGASHLFGATWLRGFLFLGDEDGRDCVLLTFVEPNRPPLRFDDFAVAYYNVKNSRQRPACTIDLQKETIETLLYLSRRLNALTDPGAIKVRLEQWEQIGSSPQHVGVFGVKPETHFARVMVDADYHLKTITNGDERIAGLPSMRQLRLDQIREETQNSQRKGLAQAPIHNRFWFNAGKPGLYRTDDRGTVILGKCPVVLLTEEEAVTADGTSQGKGKPHPLAQAFASRFSQNFDRIATIEPQYRE